MNRRCHIRNSGIDLAVAVTLGAGVNCRTSTMDLFLFFSGNGVVAVVDMVADVVAGSGAAFSDAYAVASVVVFTIYRSLTLVPEIKIPPGDDVVNAPRPNVKRAPARSS